MGIGRVLSFLLFAGFPLALVGCSVGEVQPWQKGNLAKAHMSFDPDPLESRLSQRIFQAKEGAAGGYGLAGGGCGCN